MLKGIEFERVEKVGILALDRARGASGRPPACDHARPPPALVSAAAASQAVDAAQC